MLVGFDMGFGCCGLKPPLLKKELPDRSNGPEPDNGSPDAATAEPNCIHVEFDDCNRCRQDPVMQTLPEQTRACYPLLSFGHFRTHANMSVRECMWSIRSRNRM